MHSARRPAVQPDAPRRLQWIGWHRFCRDADQCVWSRSLSWRGAPPRSQKIIRPPAPMPRSGLWQIDLALQHDPRPARPALQTPPRRQERADEHAIAGHDGIRRGQRQRPAGSTKPLMAGSPSPDRNGRVSRVIIGSVLIIVIALINPAADGVFLAAVVLGAVLVLCALYRFLLGRALAPCRIPVLVTFLGSLSRTSPNASSLAFVAAISAQYRIWVRPCRAITSASVIVPDRIARSCAAASFCGSTGLELRR